MTANEPFISHLNGWTFRLQPPQGSGPARLLVLLHGWTGDENVMWIFTRRLSRRFWLLAPRWAGIRSGRRVRLGSGQLRIFGYRPGLPACHRWIA